MAAEVVLTATALDDLRSIFLHVAEAADFDTAEAYQARLRAACLSLSDFPHRGTPRDDLAAGLRTFSFERRAVIAYSVEGGGVRILRILHRGRDLGPEFADA